jgi:ABC-type transporter Mla subunit MlaD
VPRAAYAPRVARIPGIDSLFSVLQAQAEALAALPSTVSALNGAVRGLVDVASQSRETVGALHRLAVRMDALVEELEEPMRALAPGLTRLAAVLDDPVVEELPDTLRRVQDDVLPVLRTLAETHERVAVIAGSTERIMAFVDETGRTIAGIPGAALLGRRKPAGRPVPPPGTAVDVPPRAEPVVPPVDRRG